MIEMRVGSHTSSVSSSFGLLQRYLNPPGYGQFGHRGAIGTNVRSDRMRPNASSLQDPITLLQHYQDVCNRYDIGAAVALFAEDGSIEIRGTAYRGQAALRAAHECDMGSQTQVTFSDYIVEGER